MQYEIREYKNIVFLQIKNPSRLNTPLNHSEITQLYTSIAKAHNVSGNFSLVLNDRHTMLNSEYPVCFLNDYIATFENGEVFIGIGCTIFKLSDVDNLDSEFELALGGFVKPALQKQNPKYLQNLVIARHTKILDAISITQG